MKSKRQSAEITEAIERLRATLKPGDTVYTILRSVSRSGMSRRISVKSLDCTDTAYPIRDWDYNVALATGYKRADEGIKVDGCGMDMGFALVYTLGRVLFPEGFGEACERCKARFAQKPDGKQSAKGCVGGRAHLFRGRNGDTSGWDDDGGYALKQRWL